ncbi:MAG: hypothetical protein ACFB0Z_04655 [Candidatus Phaeomarinobacter sp.]
MSRTNILVRNESGETIYFQSGEVGKHDIPEGHINYTAPFPNATLAHGEEGLVASIGDPGISSKSNTGAISLSGGPNGTHYISFVEKGHKSQASGEIPGMNNPGNYLTENDGQSGSTDAKSVTFVIKSFP